MILLISVDRAVVDLEHHVDAVLIEPDDLRIDPRVVVALLGIHIEDVLPVLLGQRRREHGARLELHLRAKLIVGQLVVALEGHAVDQRILDHVHHQRVAFAGEPHVLEQAGGVKRLQAAIQPVGIERVTRLHQHVGEDRPGLDSLVALDLDGRRSCRRCAPGAAAAVGRAGGLRRGARLGKRGTDEQQRQQAHGKQPCGAGTNQTPPSSAVRHTRIAPGNLDRYSSGGEYRPGSPSASYGLDGTGLRTGGNSHRMQPNPRTRR